jgi:nucleoside-diphosphate-sugar epimerase
MVECLVTGGAGFIGSTLVERAAARWGRVRVFDDLSTGRRGHLEPLGDLVELVVGDIRDPEAVGRAARDVRFVFHLAAMVSVAETVADPVRAEDVNVVGTLRVLEAARAAGVRRLVFASSAAVYGDDPEVPKRETMTVSPISPYGINKLAGEHHLRFFAREHGLPCVSLRLFNVFGRRQDPGSPYAAAIPRFLDALLDGRRPTVFGDGRQTRDFCPVEDVASAFLLAAEAPGLGAGEAINVGRGEETDLVDLLDRLSRAAGRPADPTFEPPRPGDVRRSVADISRARALLGFRPTASLDDTLADAVAWFREGRR